MEDILSLSIEEREFIRIAKLLLALVEDGLITDSEFPQIISTTQLVNRRAMNYEVMTSNIKQRLDLDDEIGTSNRQGPILLNLDVVEYIFGFIPAKDIKNCCLVSCKWNEVLKPILRKRATIHFFNRTNIPSIPVESLSRRPSSFLDAFENSTDPPFTSFTFMSFFDKWDISEMRKFFNRWGKNIKSLKFEESNLKSTKKVLKCYDVTALILKTPNLTSLKINNCYYNATELKVQLDKLLFVKRLSLTRCTLLVGDEKENTCLVPQEITLDSVIFKQGGNILTNFRLNDYFDLSQATKIKLFNLGDRKGILDMKNQVFKTRSLQLSTCSKYIHLPVNETNPFLNFKESKGNVFYLYLNGCPFVAKNELEIQQLFFSDSVIDLCALPNTIEKLRLFLVHEFVCKEPIHLSNLNFLNFYASRNNLDALSYFCNCTNLTEIVLHGEIIAESGLILNVDCVPKSVNKLRIKNTKSFVISGDDQSLQLDTLILEDEFFTSFSLAYQAMLKINAKVLVLSWDKIEELDTTEIVNFVLLNKQLEKAVVGSYEDLHKNSPFEKSVLSCFVEEKSNYYLFVGGLGNSINQEEFAEWTKLNELNKRL